MKSFISVLFFFVSGVIFASGDSSEDTVTISAQIFADNFVKFYFNGELIHNDAVFARDVEFFDFSAPSCGTRTFGLELKDWGNGIGTLSQYPSFAPIISPSFDTHYCIGGGGFRGFWQDPSSDNIIGTNSDWQCYVLSNGPNLETCFTESEIASISPPGTIILKGFDYENTGATTGSPDSCIFDAEPDAECCREDFFLNNFDSEWFLAEYVAQTERDWMNATEFDSDQVYPNGGVRPWEFDYSTCDKAINPQFYCSYDEDDWAGSQVIWSTDVEFDNTVLCRYQYDVPCDSSDDSSDDSP